MNKSLIAAIICSGFPSGYAKVGSKRQSNRDQNRIELGHRSASPSLQRSTFDLSAHDRTLQMSNFARAIHREKTNTRSQY
jgi:hypothetical protein